eukprot:TRINITY_DN15060_c0_g1_i1.p1 TRINITY_DN15060_c0_g1~~TRINITY_DN15060_c0_g1_i1.p1  ORF type:complete len:458 (-),score=112.74 TRINITY_DN15060_c0_g1_i1:645-2018(-)
MKRSSRGKREEDLSKKSRRNTMDIRIGCLLCALVALFFPAPTAAVYGPRSDVVQLTPSNFKEEVLQSDRIVLVEFYAPWCGHCKALAPAWEQAATALKGIVTVAAVDCDQHQSIAGEYGIKGFPTIKAFGIKQSPVEYQSGRDAVSIVEWALSQVKQVVKARLAGKSSGSGGRGGGEKSASVVLTDSSFEKEVLQSSDTWIVEFFAPWCGHCKQLAPEWKRAANALKDTNVKFGQVDCTVEQAVASKYEIRGYPTILVFGDDKDKPKPYEGARTAGALESFAREIAEANVAAPEVLQLTGKSTFEENCAKATLCLIAFLPDILDTGAAGRNKYIETLTQVAEKFKRKPYKYLWVEAGKQPELEKVVGVGGYGYPAMVAINVNKLKQAPFKGGFEKSMIEDFVRMFEREGRGIFDMATVPEIKETDSWDGKDGQLLEEDEFSLDDLMGDDSENPKEEL